MLVGWSGPPCSTYGVSTGDGKDTALMTSDNFRLLELTIIVSLPMYRAAVQSEVAELAARLRGVFPVTDDEFEALLSLLHAKLSIEIV